jgi:hypothetical protein
MPLQQDLGYYDDPVTIQDSDEFSLFSSALADILL